MSHQLVWRVRNRSDEEQTRILRLRLRMITRGGVRSGRITAISDLWRIFAFPGKPVVIRWSRSFSIAHNSTMIRFSQRIASSDQLWSELGQRAGTCGREIREVGSTVASLCGEVEGGMRIAIDQQCALQSVARPDDRECRGLVRSERFATL